jgi:hypothetical protein
MGRYFSWLLLLVCFAALEAPAQGMILNEVSNGPSGNKEYMEFVVVGTPCTTVDLRGWIIDDNNGDFACGPISGVGIAQGHVRLAVVAAWSAIPVGSILLFHNDADPNVLVPANDPTDADMDSVYVIPYSSTLLERSSGSLNCPLDPTDQIPLGCNAACPAAGSSLYLPSTYNVGGSVTPISLANGGDAAQVRDPLGNYVHGISFGTSAAVTGGPEGLKVSALSGTGKNYFLSGPPHNALANWTEGIDDGIAGGTESPGAPNNAINASYIDLLLGDCILPVEYATPLRANRTEAGVHLSWTTTREERSSSFAILRQSPGAHDWTEIGVVLSAGQPGEYQFEDGSPLEGSVYYRLRHIDEDGGAAYSNVAQVSGSLSAGQVNHQFAPNPTEGPLLLRYTSDEDMLLTLTDPLGGLVLEKKLPPLELMGEVELDLSQRPAGMLLYTLRGAHTAASGVIVVR